MIEKRIVQLCTRKVSQKKKKKSVQEKERFLQLIEELNFVFIQSYVCLKIIFFFILQLEVGQSIFNTLHACN